MLKFDPICKCCESLLKIVCQNVIEFYIVNPQLDLSSPFFPVLLSCHHYPSRGPYCIIVPCGLYTIIAVTPQ